MISFVLFLFSACSSALPQTTAPIQPAMPWPEKVDTVRAYMLSQPTSSKNAGFGRPIYTIPFADNDCHQIRLYNWECTIDILYQMPAIAAWMDSQGFRNKTGFDDPGFHGYGYYRNPEDGWGFYDIATMMYGPCGNRGPRSACGHLMCTEKNGTLLGYPWNIPEGMSPYVDPNNRDRVCPWLREGTPGTMGAA